jgi:hypothetical protein
MNCPICLEDTEDMYTIACNHQICNTCEISLRCSSNPTNHGRFIQCPLCRTVEEVQGIRTTQSYEAELLRMYATQAPVSDWYAASMQRLHAQRRLAQQLIAQQPDYASQFCQSGLREIGQCATKGKTKRNCSVVTCRNKVCRKCKHCATH